MLYVSTAHPLTHSTLDRERKRRKAQLTLWEKPNRCYCGQSFCYRCKKRSCRCKKNPAAWFWCKMLEKFT